MTPLWELAVGITGPLAVLAFLGALHLWANDRETRATVYGRDRSPGLVGDVQALHTRLDEEPALHTALLDEVRRRDHDIADRYHAVILGLEERLREVERAVAAGIDRRGRDK